VPGFFHVYQFDLEPPLPVYYQFSLTAGFTFDTFDPTHWSAFPVLAAPLPEPGAPPSPTPQSGAQKP
jgi:hypothetical protein